MYFFNIYPGATWIEFFDTATKTMTLEQAKDFCKVKGITDPKIAIEKLKGEQNEK